MVCTIEAKKLNFSNLSCNSKVITSILYEPNSLSLCLMHSDTSLSLISPFSPFSRQSISPQSQTLTLIPPTVSSACFVPLNPNPNFQGCPDDKGVVFVTCGPHNGGAKVVLKFYVMGKGGKFGGVVHVGCSQNGFCFDTKSGGVVVDVSHGMKIMLCGSPNYFVVYSASMAKLIVFGLRFVGEGKRELRLVKCAVIDCQFPITSICVSFGFLVLGELNCVRVFPLRALVKGKVASRRKSRVTRGKVENLNGEHKQEVNVQLGQRKLKMLNGVVKPVYESHEFGKNGMNVNSSKFVANGYAHNVVGVSSNANADDNRHITAKPMSLKLRQDSGEWGMQFVSFSGTVNEGVKSGVPPNMTTKVVSILPVSQRKFLVLSSNGNLLVLHLSKIGSGRMTLLPSTIQVQQLAAFPDASASSRVWISDGLNSVHVLMMACVDGTDNENSSNNEELVSHCSVTQAIFTSENVRDMVALSANTVMLLGQDCLYAYEIS